MSDDLTSKSLIANYSIKELGARALYGGVNLLLMAGYPSPDIISEAHQGLLEIVGGDSQLQSHVLESAEKIKRAKQEL